MQADLILLNANIVTLNSKQPKAQAVAIKNGKFIAVGENQEILAFNGKRTKKINFKKKTVVPGFIDTHVHCTALGRSLSQVNLRNVQSIKGIQERVKIWSKKIDQGRWIVGHGWDQERLAEHRYPTKQDLDQVTLEHPVYLLRVCSHVAVANTKALKIANITKETNNPKGGRIGRNPETGELNGILQENALSLIHNAIPQPSEKEITDTCLLACRRMVGEGLTTVHWILNSMTEIRILQKLNSQQVLPLRVYLLIPVEFLENLIDLRLPKEFDGNKIKIGCIKMLADGSLGGRTAALKQFYKDAPRTKGLMLYSRKRLGELMSKVHKADFQLAIHAIGDEAVETSLRILENVLKKHPKKDHRHRLEHSSVLNPRLIKKMKKLEVIASIQPHFTVSDFWITERLGKERARWTYAFKSLNEEGVTLMGGSDAPIEPVSPILGIWAAVTREKFPREQLTIDEALRLYTKNAAYGSFEEGVKGTIEEGKFADLVLLSHDPYKVAQKQIREIKVEMTVVGGRIVYKKQQ